VKSEMNEATLENSELLVEQSDITKSCFSHSPIRPLEQDEILVRIDKFGFTANNLSYAVLGKRSLYKFFDFFPASDEKFGKVNVWGYATIVKSSNPNFNTGDRIFGYFPLAKYTILLCPPALMRDDWFQSAREKELPPDWRVYNDYHLLTVDPHYDPKYENEILIFRPVWWTSYFLSDFLQEHGYFQGSTIIISSASSKMAYGLAFLLRGKRRLIGLTSNRGKEFLQCHPFFDQVVLYDHLSTLSIDPKEKVLYVDVAGNSQLLHAVHAQFNSQLSMVIQVGLAHWDKVGQSISQKESFPFPCQIFFCPPWIKKRGQELGAELSSRMAAAWQVLLDHFDQWVKIREGCGEEAVSKVYNSFVSGQIDPEEGWVLSLYDEQLPH